MSERQDQLTSITKDLEDYVKAFCPCSDDGIYNDFSGEKCNDAFLMLQQALGSLDSDGK